MKCVIVTLWIIVIFRAFDTGWNGNFLFVCAIAQFHLYLLDPPSSLLCTIFHLYLKILQPPLLSRHNCWENDSPWFWYINLSICQTICLPIQLGPWSYANVFSYSSTRFPSLTVIISIFMGWVRKTPNLSNCNKEVVFFGGLLMWCWEKESWFRRKNLLKCENEVVHLLWESCWLRRCATGEWACFY